MTEKAFEKAEKLMSESKRISIRLEQLGEIYYGITSNRDNYGMEETEVHFYIKSPYREYPLGTCITTENLLNYVESEIKALTDRRKTIERVFKEL